MYMWWRIISNPSNLEFLEFDLFPSNCKYECGKSCDVGECLDYENFKCRKRLIDKLVDECSENIDVNESENVTSNKYKHVCGSCTIYIKLFVIFFIISIIISSVVVCFL